MGSLGTTAASVVLVVAAALGCAPQRPARTPNLVLLILDTLRADRLGAYGFPLDTSPELDRLAARGVLFERTFASSSWTRPSVASLLTSLPPRRLGIYREQGQVLDDRFETLPELLRRSGYRTLGATANPNLNHSFQMDQGFERYSDSHAIFPWMLGPGPRTSQERLTTAPELFELAQRWIDEHPEGPLYVQLDLMEMHEHLRGGARSMIRDEQRALFPGRDDRAYLQSLRQLSSDVGGFIERLAQRPGWEDAVFVVTSDHGEGLQDHPDVAFADAHGWVLYESQVLVPLIVYRARWPEGSVHPGTRIGQPVSLLDLAPTLLDLAGVPVPPDMEGASLLPLLRGQAGHDRPTSFVAETEFRGQHKIAVFESGWEYIENRRPHPRTPLDPTELQRAGGGEDGPRTNLIADHPGVANDLRAQLHDWERRVHRAPPTLRPLPPEERRRLEALGYLDEG